MINSKNVYFNIWVITLLLIIFLRGYFIYQSKHFVLFNINSNLSRNNNKLSLLCGRKIDLNLADEEQLRFIPGIGKQIAKRIVNKRKSLIKIRSWNDIRSIDGIGDKRLTILKQYCFIDYKFD